MSRLLNTRTACFQGPVALHRLQGVVVVTPLLRVMYHDEHVAQLGQILRRVSGNRDVRLIAVDLSRMESMGSAVLGALFRPIPDLRQRGGHMAWCHLSQPFREISQLHRLDRILHVAETLEQAIAWLVAAPPAPAQIVYPIL